MIKNIKVKAVLITLVIVAIFGYIELYPFGNYGWTVFILLPLFIGFLPPYIVGYKQKISKRQSYNLSLITFVITLVGLLIFAIEGLICIAMAVPICIIPVYLGSHIAYFITDNKWSNKTNTTIILLLISLSTMSFDYVNQPTELIPVKTTVVIDAPIETVWSQVVTFDKIEEPKDWIFTTGISYPTDATIEGTGVGAIRYCNFSTGSFVEPRTTWNEPTVLQFDVIDQPIPMNEFNPFWDVHPPHLDGYFKSYKGQFKLTKLDENKTELEGTTWYQVDITPEFYWKAWSDFIIHRIHKRVLNHIKTSSETLQLLTSY